MVSTNFQIPAEVAEAVSINTPKKYFFKNGIITTWPMGNADAMFFLCYMYFSRSVPEASLHLATH